MLLDKYRRVACGIVFNDIPNGENCEARFKDGLCMLNIPLSQLDAEGNRDASKVKIGYNNIIISGSSWSNCVIGALANYCDPDSEDGAERTFARKVLEAELSWAQCLSLGNVTIALPNGPFTNLANIINSYLKDMSDTNCNIMMKVKLSSQPNESDLSKGDIGDITSSDWSRWNTFRTLCETDKKLAVALEITENIPNCMEVDRWKGEPVTYIILDAGLFVKNGRGFPVLRRQHQLVLRSLNDSKAMVMLSGTEGCEYPVNQLVMYIHHLYKDWPNEFDENEFIRGYDDHLQLPLQPLKDQLSNLTYEIFEKDEIKYSLYQRAIRLALIDLNGKNENSTFVIMVVGAGRGPLVAASLNASEFSGVPVRVYAVEKNPNAVIHMRHENIVRWQDKVTIVSQDMRYWDAPEKADIIVSELLGSVGDNELSPECLDGAQRFLKEGGIMIPESYSSYVRPLMSHKLFAEIELMRNPRKNDRFHSEQIYVCKISNAFYIDDAQKLFTFSHPNFDKEIDNTRYGSLKFDVKCDSVLHGFAAYFVSVLYGDAVLSTLPGCETERMFSWFPGLFPISEPIQLKKGDKIEVKFWRKISESGVWYEWAVTKPTASHLHNPNGRSYKIGALC